MSRDLIDDASFLAAAVEASPGAIVAVDLDGRVVHWNKAAEKMLGFRQQDVVGRSLMSVVPEDSRAAALEILDRVRSGGTIVEHEVERLRHDGSSMIVSLTVVPLRSAGEICGTVGFMTDVTERKSLEEALRRNERLAALGTLSAGIAHEINNPVGGILMAAEYAAGALERDDSDTVVRKALADIREDAGRCREIVRGLLHLAHEGAEERRPCEPDELIASAIERARQPAIGVELRRVTLPEPVTVRVARTEVELALVNVLVNAVEAGCSSIEIQTRLSDDERYVRIAFRDDGHGIADELVDKLFDPLFTTRRQQGARGLGLGVAHAIIKNHHGALDVTSHQNAGTTVTIELPVDFESSSA